MSRFVTGEDRSQSTLLPASLDDYVTEDNPVRVVDVFVDNLDLADLGFERVIAQATGRPGYTRPRCSRSISTGTSTGYSPADGWSAKHSAISSSCG